MLRKNWSATGSFLKQDRPRALDLLGVKSQLVFNTFLNKFLNRVEHADDLEYAIGVARAHNRAMLDFCSVDRRLLATGYVPLADFARAREMAKEVVEMGCKALLIASRCPKGHSPSHVGLFPVWEIAQEAGLPVVFHVGGGGELLRPGLLRERAASGSRLPRRRGELPLRRLHADPVSAHADALGADLRRRPRALPAAQDRRDRAGRVVAAELPAPARLRARGLRAPRGAAAQALAAPERVRAPAGAGDALPRRGRRLDHRAVRARRSACSRPTIRTSRAAGIR